jgi:hypothetical protein
MFPAQYVVFLELIGEPGLSIDDKQLQVLQNSADSEVDRQLCITNPEYKDCRGDGELGPLTCVLVRSGTFSIFLNKNLVTDRVSAVQIKPHRLFYDNQIDHFSPLNHIDQ